MTYTDALARIRTLRAEYPAAEISTDLIRLEDGFVVFRAAIVLPDGGKATGHGSASRDDRNDFIEHAETTALTRALGALGYDVDDESESTDGERDVPTPAIVRSTTPERISPTEPPVLVDDVVEPTRVLTRTPVTADEPVPTQSPNPPTPMPNRGGPDRRQSSQSSRPAAPVEIGTARERTSSPTPFPNQSTAATSSGRPPVAPVETNDQPPLEDYSWTAFWKWAREQGYESKGGIEAFIGRQMNNLNPAEVRQLIIAKRGGS